MIQLLQDLFNSRQFIPHGHCYLWKPGLVWLHILSDSLIALAYYSIPILLVYIVRKREDLPFDRIFMLFGAFIIACGTGHLLNVWTLWHPVYWLSGALKAITAGLSLCTATVVVRLIPKILALPSPIQLAAEIDDRKRAEERLKLAIDNIPQFMFWKDINSVYQGCNLNFARAAGFDNPGEIVGKTDYELPWKREESDFFRLCDRRVMDTDTPEYHIIETQLRADGTQTWVDTNKVPLHDAEGNVVGIIGTYEDITPRKQAEAQLEKALQQLTFHVENSPLAVIEWDKNFRVQRWSKQAEKLFGWKAEEVVNRHPNDWKIIYDRDLEAVNGVLTRLLNGTDPRNFTCNRNYTKDGAVLHCEWYNSALFDESGNLVSIQSRVLDVTAREQASSALRENEERYRAVVEQTSEGIFLVDANNKYLLEANVACQNLLGYASEEIPHLTLYDIVALDRAIVDRNAERIRSAKHGYLGEAQHRRKDGTIVDAEVRINLISYGGREVFCVVFSDVTDRKQAELALRRSETRYRQLAQKEELVNILAGQIRKSLDLPTIVQTAVAEIRSLLKLDRCNFAWYRIQANPPVWEIIDEAKASIYSSHIGVYSAAVVEPLSDKLVKQEIIRVDDVEKLDEPVMQKFLRQTGYTSVIVLPIETRGKIGVVVCGRCSGFQPWSDDEVELLQAVTDQLAIAINQAELYAQSWETAKRATAQANQLEKTLQELQQTQTQLIQSEKMSSLGQMVAGIAHEINNPVNFIYGNLVHVGEYTENLLHLLSLYQKYYPQPAAEIKEAIDDLDLDFLRKDLSKILSSMKVGADRIRQIILSLRNFSRLDEAEFKEVNIHEGIDNTLLILQNRLNSHAGGDRERFAIEVIKDYGNLPKVKCYAGQLNQVFMNVIANAIDALERFEDWKAGKLSDVGGYCIFPRFGVESSKTQTVKPCKPTIWIRTEVMGDAIAIRIADNGPGMSDEIRRKLFDPFFTTKPVGKGTGLGLSVGYQIVVQKHGGVLRCISSPGKGAEFAIEIPIRQQHQKTA